MKNSLAILTTVFPGAMRFASDLIESLANQSVKEFDWIVLNDGIPSNEISKKVNNRFFSEQIFVNGIKPSQNRWLGIQYCLNQGYRYILFQDVDDWMGCMRVEEALIHLEFHPIVFHDLNLVDESGKLISEKIWSNRFTHHELIDSNFLRDKNCVGLGNAAIRTSVVTRTLKIPSDILAVDWFIFYHFLQQYQALFINRPSVFYRQYIGNSAGIGYLTVERIEKAIAVKKKHYKALVEQFSDLYAEQEKLMFFEEHIFKQPEKLLDYLIKNKLKGISSFWWEETNYSL